MISNKTFNRFYINLSVVFGKTKADGRVTRDLGSLQEIDMVKLASKVHTNGRSTELLSPLKKLKNDNVIPHSVSLLRYPRDVETTSLT